MATLLLKAFLLTIVLSYSSAQVLNEVKSHFLWKTNFALISLFGNPFAFVESAAPPEEGKKLKEKIKKGKELLEDLNVNLEKIKKSLAQQIEVEKEVLERIIEIKDEFTAMQVDATDLPKDLIEKFKEKTLEAFKFIMESYGLHNILQKAKAQAEPEADVIEAEPEADGTDNREKSRKRRKSTDILKPVAAAAAAFVDSQTEKKFEKEL